MSPEEKRVKEGISRRKRIAFTAAMLTIPFLLTVILELGLRLFDYGGNLDLFVKEERGNSSEYVLNKNVVNRYFFRKGIKTPIPHSERFAVKKDSATYRIFCLGASTTQGFPYPPNAAFPAMLKNILSTLHPDRQIEVINCGITAITSHSVLDMGREILEKYQPDLLVLYTGHNEFYGALGQASRLSLFENRTMMQAFLRMQRSRVVLMARNILIGLFGERLTRENVIDRTVAKETGIRFDSPLFRRTEKHFQANLEDMVAAARQAGTDIMLSTLVSNQSDRAPFASLHSESLTSADSLRWSELVQGANDHKIHGRFEQAAHLLEQALRIDSSFAQMHFMLAECYEALQQPELAQHHFSLACDLDVIRFRAPSTFNRIILETGEKYQVAVADLERTFMEASEGVIGNNLILEHVHPNQQGYLLIAKAVAATMADRGMLRQSWDWTNDKPDSVYLAMSHLTDLDREVVNYRVYRLTTHWPFSGEGSYERVGNERTEQLAKALVDEGHGSLVEAHLDLGLEYYHQNELDKALAEYKAALAIEPVCETYSRIGLLYAKKTERAYRVSKDYESASENYRHGLAYFKKGLERCPDNLNLNLNIGLLYGLRNDKTDSALTYLRKALELDGSHKNALRQIGQLYVRRGELEKAESHFQRAIQRHPNQAEFHRSLGMVYARQNDLARAESLINQALELKPNDALAKHFLNQIKARKRSLSN